MGKKEYKPLTIPQLEWQKKTLTKTYGELVAQPLEPGFGITIGNAIRRVLLGAIEGTAVTSVIVKGVNNEFSVVSGVIEDVMQILLNIKEIVIRNKEGKPGTMHLKVKGETIARVSDITADEHLELVNTDHVLAHVTSDTDFEVTFFVENGRGYCPAKWPLDKPYQKDGRVYLDALFSPIRKVMFHVEKTRVGKDIDYDKLTLNISTDGSENPLYVLHYAVSVLRTQLEHFLTSAEIPFNIIAAAADEVKEDIKPSQIEKLGLKGVSVEFFLKPIDELELSVRAHNCLINAGVKRVIDLVNMSKGDILKIKNFGAKSLDELEENIEVIGLSFDMNIDEKDVKKVLATRKESA